MTPLPILLERKIGELFDFRARQFFSPEDVNAYVERRDYLNFKEGFEKYKKLLASLHKLPRSRTYVGIEVEIERAPGAFVHSGWREIKDGSLRNGGKEYVSFVLPVDLVNPALANLYAPLSLCDPLPEFSWRTSIHIHLCVRERTIEEVLKFLLLYCVFERPLFQFASEEREKSIFCVPITKSNLDEALSDFFNQTTSINGLFREWQKYSALNLTRLGDYGTIEFRHFPGSWDIKKISDWIGLLLSLYNASIEIPLQQIINYVTVLNTTSEYDLFKEKVFGKQQANRLQIPNIELISEGISFCKRCLSDLGKDCPIAEDSSMMRFIRREQQAKKEERLLGNEELKVKIQEWKKIPRIRIPNGPVVGLNQLHDVFLQPMPDAIHEEWILDDEEIRERE